MKNIQFRVIHKLSSKEYILNLKEMLQFTAQQNFREYKITPIKCRKYKILEALSFSCFTVAIVLLLTEIIMKWI